jgi:hypothetical protein
MPPLTEAQRAYRRQRQADPAYREWKRAYDAAKYRRNRERILAQQRAHARSPERQEQLRAYQRAYVQKPEVKERRRRLYALRRYGTETLPPRPKKEKPCRPTPTPTHSQKKAASSSAKNVPRRAAPSGHTATSKRTGPTQSAAPTPVTATTAVSQSLPTTPPKPPWTPTFSEGRPWSPPPRVKPATYLCIHGHPFPTKRQADAHSRRHEKAA